ncbi:DNA mismatch repair ATPase msh1 [Irineochytrium annulatum]|nr:DNA mismatch repair ATPase msh1 [Irineochytrium annulatum]
MGKVIISTIPQTNMKEDSTQSELPKGRRGPSRLRGQVADREPRPEDEPKDTFAPKNITTIRAEVQELQRQYPTHVLLTQVGGFYEVFDCSSYMDEVALLLDFQKSTSGNMIGFPKASLQKYVHRLLAAGKTVAVVDQIAKDENISRTKAFRRQVVRIVTPGTVLPEELEERKDNNFLLAVVSRQRADDAEVTTSRPELQPTVGMAWCDVSTGEFYVSSCSPSDLGTEILRIRPSEIIACESLLDDISKEAVARRTQREGTHLTREDESFFDPPTSMADLITYLREANKAPEDVSDPVDAARNAKDMQTASNILLDAVRMQMQMPGLQVEAAAAAGAIVGYLRKTFLVPFTPNLQVPQTMEGKGKMVIDGRALRALEVVQPLNEAAGPGVKPMTVLNQVDYTETAAGGRLLKNRLLYPSTSIEEIHARHSLVSCFLADLSHLFLDPVQRLLSRIPDIERALQRLHNGTTNPTDVLKIISGLRAVGDLRNFINGHDGVATEDGEAWEGLLRVVEGLDTCPEIEDAYGGMFMNEDGKETAVPSKIKEPGCVGRGLSKNLDALKDELALRRKDKTRLETLLKNTFHASAELAYDKKEGPHVFFAPGKNAAGLNKLILADDNFEVVDKSVGKKTTLKYKHKAWTNLHALLSKTEMENVECENAILGEAGDFVKTFSQAIVATSRAVGELDVAASSAIGALRMAYCRPDVVPGNVMEIKRGRHAVVERIVGKDQYVPNDLHLTEDERIWIVTGPNMGGKSTYLRQNALIAIMAQAGLYVPAASARLGVVDRIFARVGASDNISEKQSTFMVEMAEVADILRSATDQSLVVMDEIGRGTSSAEGCACALAVLEDLSNRTGCRTLFATHFHEIADEVIGRGGKTSIRGPRFVMSDIAFDEHGQPEFDFTIKDGICKGSYAVETAKLAGK